MKTGRNRSNCFKITNLLLKRQTLTIFNGGTADMADMYFDCFYSLRVACAWRKFCIGFFSPFSSLSKSLSHSFQELVSVTLSAAK